ncbi:MAG: hypothetical protein R3E08_05020 [Thiotrichaceae bacterium]
MKTQKYLVIAALLAGMSNVNAADYTLDASTMGVGATAGENLVVKEGCLDPSKTTCAEKVKWLAAISPTKVGNIQVAAQLIGDFEVVITADFASEAKAINLLTADNKGIALRFNGDGSSSSSSFITNGIGEGGDNTFYRLPNWNLYDSFNEVKITVQQGVAKFYTNGTSGKPIIFDASVIFTRVVIEGVKSDDRLSDVKVRGIQGTTACSSGGTGTTPTATTKIDGIATNGFVSSANKMIAGVLISGGTKRTMVRASSVDGAVDPMVEIYTYPDRKLLGSNDSWATSTAAAELTQKKLAPARATDAATIISLPPGLFTMEVTSRNGGSGASVIEVYDMAVFP